MKKHAVILYSGGKDSHLALYYAVEKGYVPHLFFADAEDNQLKISKNLITSDIIKYHPILMNIPINTVKIKKTRPNIDTLRKILVKFKKFSDVTLFNSDYQIADKKDKEIYKNTLKLCKQINIKFIPFTEIIKEDSLFAPIKMSLKNKIKSCIVSVQKEINRKWLGKYADSKFISYLKTKIKKGIHIDGNSYQTLVIKSPLFNGKSLKITESEILYDSEEEQHVLKIKGIKIV